MVPTLREVISGARKKNVAIGHFNISNLEGLWGVFNAARSLNVPVIIGTSEGERGFIGVQQAVALIGSLRKEYDYPIYLNADHSYSFEKVKEAIDAGYDAVIFDGNGTKLSFDDNVRVTKQCVEYAKRMRGELGTDILVEGEIGYIGTSSKILAAIPEGVSFASEDLTKPEEIQAFVEQTGVDLMAPAVGNFHGMFGGGKKLDIPRIEALSKAAGVPLVLHGGSGTHNEDFVAAIAHGVGIVHINTEIRVAYRKALMIALQEDPDEIAPYKFLKGAVQAIQQVVTERLKLFNNIQ